MEKCIRQEFIDYCNRNWSVSSEEVRVALNNMDKYRSPLEMANERVSNYIKELADDFRIENNLDEDWFETTFNSTEEVFWNLKAINMDDKITINVTEEELSIIVGALRHYMVDTKGEYSGSVSLVYMKMERIAEKR